MAGFDRNRFVGLPDNIAEGLTCSICLNVFSNPVITECYHTFCKRCLQQTIHNGSDSCPQCRQRLSPKRSVGTADSDNTIIILRDQRMYVVGRNLALNDVINSLQIRCEYDFNGCQELIQLSLLSSHLKQCHHRYCKTCELNVKRDEQHDCIRALKRDRDLWKSKSDDSQKTIDSLKANLSNKSKIINQISRNKQKVINELKQELQKLKEPNQSDENRANGSSEKSNALTEDTADCDQCVLSFPENELI